MTVLVTGAAGFIGYHVCAALRRRGETVIAVDDLNDYYDVGLKRARLAQLDDQNGFTFYHQDIADAAGMEDVCRRHAPIRRVVHLAAQAGVRYSLTNPMAYIQANLAGQAVILEACRHSDGFEHLVYASSSSVYGGNTKLPFAESDRVDRPVSLYAATKRADELLGHCYSHLYDLPMTGLRFFTVYGPWGRPDMAAFLFTKAIFDDQPITVFNNGDMKRDFTYIDDIVAGVIAALDRPPPADDGGVRHCLYNIGNHRPEPLLRFIEVIEEAVGRTAEKILAPMQPGDVPATYADITAIQNDLGFAPSTPIEVGIPRFVAWFRDYHGL